MAATSIVIMPGQLARRAELYHQFASLTSAGLGISQTIEQLRRYPPARDFRLPLENVLREIARGFTFTESIRRSGDWLPDFDIALIEAGERSGRLDACFRKLGDYYENRARMARQMIADMLYPAFLVHFAVFIIPFAQMFTSGNVLRYLAQTLGILLPLYLLVALVIFAMQGGHGERWRSLLETILHPVPVLGSARRDLALARLAMSLEALISAGVGIVEAWDLSAKVSGSSALRRAIQSWKRSVAGGQTVAEAITASGAFPEMFSNQYNSGEISGKLDEVLLRLQNYYEDSGRRKMHMLAQWTPRIIGILVMIAIGIYIIRFWSNYYNNMWKAVGP